MTIGIQRINQRPVHHDTIMGLGKGWAIMNNLHLITGDIDQLIIFRLQWTNIDKAIFGEFVQGHQPFAVGIFGFAHGGMVMTRLIMHIQF